MIEILVVLIIYLIIDRIQAKHPAENDDEPILFEASPDDTAEERKEKKEMEEFIIYEDIMNDK